MQMTFRFSPRFGICSSINSMARTESKVLAMLKFHEHAIHPPAEKAPPPPPARNTQPFPPLSPLYRGRTPSTPNWTRIARSATPSRPARSVSRRRGRSPSLRIRIARSATPSRPAMSVSPRHERSPTPSSAYTPLSTPCPPSRRRAPRRARSPTPSAPITPIPQRITRSPTPTRPARRRRRSSSSHSPLATKRRRAASPPADEQLLAISAWLLDGSDAVEAIVPVNRGFMKLSDNKIDLGKLGLEMGTPLQKFVRSEAGGSWVNFGWGTTLHVGNARQMALRGKKVRNLKNWELAEPHMDL
ncbi:hypothetical protein C8R43DRAFT_1115922 [Mycena crocata]|nr:hypothetical protein C8R43DRAFT_1115922 [Mycena crocata]